MKKKWLQTGYNLGGEGVQSFQFDLTNTDCPVWKKFDNGENGGIDAKFLVFNRWWAESDMDAEDLSKVALTVIDDWLDEEIVGFEPEEG